MKNADEIYRRMYARCFSAMKVELDKQKISGRSSPVSIISIIDQLLQAVSEEIAREEK